MASTVAGVLLTGVHGSRPSSGVTAGTLYACSTHGLIYQTSDTGSTWATWQDSATAGGGNPQFTTIELGHASDTTIARASAGNLTVEGNALYRAGGTDVPVADGGTGASTATAGFDALSPMTTAGDIIVGGASGTRTRLAKGAAGANLSTYNGSVAWNGGTSFPASPATGDRYWRSDLVMEFVYDGTRWVSTTLLELRTSPDQDMPYTTTSKSQRAASPILVGTDIWLVKTQTWFYVAGGTALSGSHKWVGTLVFGATTIDTVNVNSGASNAHRQSTAVAIGALLGANFEFDISWAKTGTPGDLYTQTVISYRHVTT